MDMVSGEGTDFGGVERAGWKGVKGEKVGQL